MSTTTDKVIRIGGSRRAAAYDWHIERSVLGCLMTSTDKQEAQRMIAELRPADFHRPTHRDLLTLLRDIAVDAAPDFSLVCSLSQDRTDLNIGPISEVATMCGNAPLVEQFDGYLKRLREFTTRRDAVMRIAEAEERIAEGDADEAVRAIEAGATDTRTPTELDTAVEGFPGVLDRMDCKGENDPRPLPVVSNVETACRYDPRLVESVWLDEWTNTLMWRELGRDRPITDEDVGRVTTYLGRAYRLHVKPHVVHPVLAMQGKRRARNPLVDYLTALSWDGVKRLNEWLTTVYGVPCDELHCSIGRRWLIQAVARAKDPGCKADTVLVLRGEQGLMKSSSLSIIAGGKPYFADTPIKIGNTKSYLAMGRVWIYELAEGESLRKSDANEAKAFLSAADDTYVPPYGRFAITVPRHTVFATTINDPTFLVDDTGSRRFWPIECTRVDLAWLRENRDQLLAEAAVHYERVVEARRRGQAVADEDRWWFTSAENVALEKHNDAYRHEDAWYEPIAKWTREQGLAAYITSWEVGTKALELNAQDMKTPVTMRIGSILRALGWKRKKVRAAGGGETIWGYVRGDALIPPSAPDIPV